MRPIRLRALAANLTYRAGAQRGVRALRQEWKASRGAVAFLHTPIRARSRAIRYLLWMLMRTCCCTGGDRRTESDLVTRERHAVLRGS
jgi:hypothetical protein